MVEMKQSQLGNSSGEEEQKESVEQCRLKAKRAGKKKASKDELSDAEKAFINQGFGESSVSGTMYQGSDSSDLDIKEVHVPYLRTPVVPPTKWQDSYSLIGNKPKRCYLTGEAITNDDYFIFHSHKIHNAEHGAGFFIKAGQLASLQKHAFFPHRTDKDQCFYVQKSDVTVLPASRTIAACCSDSVNYRVTVTVADKAQQQQLKFAEKQSSLSLPFYRALNPFSEKSGVSYLPGNFSGQQKKMENQRSPNNRAEMHDASIGNSCRRLYNTFVHNDSLWQKSKAVYLLLNGTHYDLEVEGHGAKGLLDLLIFPLIARKLIVDRLQPEASSALITAAAFAIAVPLEIARFTASLALTLLAVPFLILASVVKGLYDCTTGCCQQEPAIANQQKL